MFDLGILCSLLGLAYVLVVIVLGLVAPNPIGGWSSLMAVVLVIGGIQMTMMGILGECLWRTLEAARRRPTSFVEETVGWESPAEAQATEPETQLAGREFAT